ncbi:MAG: 50S ribosomal protein L18e [Thaumarchaeota archaeon]|nr:50S ribosomal protein L18e [Nitrososphaerota archaeon]
MTSSNPLHRHVAVMLEKAGRSEKAPIWDVASRLLSRPAGTQIEVNLGRISRISSAGQALFVPGKVLGSGIIDKKVVVGAFSFSSSARSKIESAGGSALSVEQFLKKYPKGSGVKLVE